MVKAAQQNNIAKSVYLHTCRSHNVMLFPWLLSLSEALVCALEQVVLDPRAGLKQRGWSYAGTSKRLCQWAQSCWVKLQAEMSGLNLVVLSCLNPVVLSCLNPVLLSCHNNVLLAICESSCKVWMTDWPSQGALILGGRWDTALTVLKNGFLK